MGPLQHDEAPYVSTGHLPSPEQVRRAVDDAYARYRMVAEGERSRVYPALPMQSTVRDDPMSFARVASVQS